MHFVSRSDHDVKLVIDDLRDPAFDCLLARNSKLGLKALNETPRLDEVWLDHDLSGRDTIMPVVDWLLERAAWGNPWLRVIAQPLRIATDSP